MQKNFQSFETWHLFQSFFYSALKIQISVSVSASVCLSNCLLLTLLNCTFLCLCLSVKTIFFFFNCCHFFLVLPFLFLYSIFHWFFILFFLHNFKNTCCVFLDIIFHSSFIYVTDLVKWTWPLACLSLFSIKFWIWVSTSIWNLALTQSCFSPITTLGLFLRPILTITSVWKTGETEGFDLGTFRINSWKLKSA